MGSIQSPYTPQAPSNFFDSAAVKKYGKKTLGDHLIGTVTDDPDLPALGSSITRIVQLSSSDDQSIQQLAYFVLSDVALTQKILRLSNSVTFKSVSSKVNTSITKAIFLLGFNSVKTCALAMLLVDSMSGKRAEHVRTELIYALAASMVSRELVKISSFKDAEEIAVVALFKNLGRLLLAGYDHDLYQKLMTLVEQGTHTPIQASQAVLDFNLDTLSETILGKWNIPVSIIQALKNKPTGILNAARNKQEWMQQAAEFSEKAASLILAATGAEDSELKNKLLNRFGTALNLDKDKLDQLILNASAETRTLLINANLLTIDKSKKINSDTTQIESDISVEDSLNELVFSHAEDYTPEIIQRYPSGKPHNASVLLLAGVQDVTEIMASGKYNLDDLIMLVLETYYNSLGFRFITFCFRDPNTNLFRARSSLGKNNMEYQKAFNFPTVPSNELFHLALKNNVDLLISDAYIPKIRKLIPQWHVDLLPEARSFILLPLVVNEKPMGLFYADRALEAPEGITTEETRLIRTLKSQVLTAFNSR